MTTEQRNLAYQGPANELGLWIVFGVFGFIAGILAFVGLVTLALTWPFIRAAMLRKQWKAERQEARAKRYWERKRLERETCAMADLECWFADQYPPMHTPKRWRTA